MSDQQNEKAQDSEDLKAEITTEDTANKLVLFPSKRMYPFYPWQVWAVGWLAIFKGLLWLSTNPNVPGVLSYLFAFKYIIFMIPFIILGIGIWNFRKWSVFGLIALCIADLVFFILIPQASAYIAGKHFVLISAFLLLCNGPVGDVLILVLSPVLLKHAGKKPLLKTS